MWVLIQVLVSQLVVNSIIHNNFYFKYCALYVCNLLGEVNIPGEDDSFDFGSGAGFYVDATQDPWKKNYRMYSYVTKELPQLIAENFPVIPNMQSIMGHRYE